jgi:hypothetical protein
MIGQTHAFGKGSSKSESAQSLYYLLAEKQAFASNGTKPARIVF